MARTWKEVKADLEQQTAELFVTCPDEIKRFHYGIITHSDAGKNALDQYFGHWVHAYAGYYGRVDNIGYLIRLATDPRFDLKQLRAVFDIYDATGAPFFAEYGGQHMQAKATEAVAEAWDSVTSRDELAELLKSYHAFISRLYWWFHWYFPWGVGPALCHRVSPEDIKEMVRLSQPSKT